MGKIALLTLEGIKGDKKFCVRRLWSKGARRTGGLDFLTRGHTPRGYAVCMGHARTFVLHAIVWRMHVGRYRTVRTFVLTPDRARYRHDTAH